MVDRVYKITGDIFIKNYKYRANYKNSDKLALEISTSADGFGNIKMVSADKYTKNEHNFRLTFERCAVFSKYRYCEAVGS